MNLSPQNLLQVVAVFGSVSLTHVHRNASDSLPIYWPYFVWQPSRAVRVGDLVEACPPLDAARQAHDRSYAPPGGCPGGVAPFLKLVAAVGGDVVMVTPQAVSVNGRALPNSAQIQRDSLGRSIVSRGYGTHRLAAGELWLYGTNPRSFDSRRFAAVPTSAVRYEAWAPGARLPNLPVRR